MFPQTRSHLSADYLMPGEREEPDQEDSSVPHQPRDSTEAEEDPAVVSLSDSDRLLRGLPVEGGDGGRTFQSDLPAPEFKL